MGNYWPDNGAPWTARERAAYRKGAQKAESRTADEIRRLHQRIAELERDRKDPPMNIADMDNKQLMDEYRKYDKAVSDAPHWGAALAEMSKYREALSREAKRRGLLPSAYELSTKNQTTSADRLFGKSIVYGKEADHATPYMTRYWIGRLRLHIFHRGDADPDCHDHPWDFWTFPFHSYVEEVALPYDLKDYAVETDSAGPTPAKFKLVYQVVPAWRLTFRAAEHTHRVLGKLDADAAARGWTQTGCVPGKVITLVWRSGDKRKWGFLRNRDGKWCWTPWKEYVFGGGKNAPCE